MENLEMKKTNIIFVLCGLLVALFSCGGGDVKLNQTINFNYQAPRNISEGSFTLKATSTSALPVTFQSSDTAIAIIKDSVLYLKKPGTVNLTAVQKGNERYYQAPNVVRTLTINDDINANKWNQTITFILNDSVWKVSQGTLKLNATSSSGLPVTFTSSNVAYASIKGNLLEVESSAIIGNDYGVFVTVTVSQAGNYVYNSAPTVSRRLRVIHDVH